MPDAPNNANTNRISEDQKAVLAKRRGMAAAQISDPKERTEFIERQGDEEAKNKGELPATSFQKMGQQAALKGYKHGTDRVPSTGPAVLHKDEAVLNKGDASEYRDAKSKAIYDLASSRLGGNDHDGDDKPPKEIKEIRTRKAKTGGYIHEHHHTRPEHHPMEEHTSPEQDAMVGHMMENMGTPNPGEAQADAGESGIQG